MLYLISLFEEIAIFFVTIILGIILINMIDKLQIERTTTKTSDSTFNLYSNLQIGKGNQVKFLNKEDKRNQIQLWNIFNLD